MAGRMGGVKSPTQNLTVHAVDAEQGLLLIKGAVPGPTGGLVLVRTAAKGSVHRMTASVDVVDRDGRRRPARSSSPAEIFDVTGQRAADPPGRRGPARCGPAGHPQHQDPRRGRGGGAKPYRQKGTGRARQGSIRAPQFAGGGVVHGPTPRSYEQRTPKKMKAAALRGALSDRARNGRVHVVSRLRRRRHAVDQGQRSRRWPMWSTTAATCSSSLDRDDRRRWKSLRNVPDVHLLAPTSSTPTTCWSATTWSSPRRARRVPRRLTLVPVEEPAAPSQGRRARPARRADRKTSTPAEERRQTPAARRAVREDEQQKSAAAEEKA